MSWQRSEERLPHSCRTRRKLKLIRTWRQMTPRLGRVPVGKPEMSAFLFPSNCLLVGFLITGNCLIPSTPRFSSAVNSGTADPDNSSMWIIRNTSGTVRYTGYCHIQCIRMFQFDPQQVRLKLLFCVTLPSGHSNLSRNEPDFYFTVEVPILKGFDLLSLVKRTLRSRGHLETIYFCTFFHFLLPHFLLHFLICFGRRDVHFGYHPVHYLLFTRAYCQLYFFTSPVIASFFLIITQWSSHHF